MPMSVWVDHRLKFMIALWNSGKSAKEIAEILNCDKDVRITRDSILGKVYRLRADPEMRHLITRVQVRRMWEPRRRWRG